MKWFFFIIVFFLSIALIRFAYGLTANSSEYVVMRFLDSLPDIKSDFRAVIDIFKVISYRLLDLKSAINSKNLLKFLSSFSEVIMSFLDLPVAIAYSIYLILVDLVKMLEIWFALLYGETVVPIRSA